MVYEHRDATSILLPEDRESIELTVSPGAIFWSLEWPVGEVLCEGGGVWSDPERFMRFHIEGDML